MIAPDCTPPGATGHGSKRWLVLASLMALGCGTGTSVPLRDEGKPAGELRAMLADADPEVQARGAFGLSRHGPAAAEAVPELIARLYGSTPLVRQNAALALGAVGPGAKAAVPALTEALSDPEWTVRRQAALALGAIGPDAKPALPALRKLDADPQKVVRSAAQEARKKIDQASGGR
jgi:phosphotransferase system HPr-like phosphotransfer protein